MNAHLGLIHDYLGSLAEFAGRRRLAFILGVMLLAGLVESIGLLALLPLLEVLEPNARAAFDLPGLGRLDLPLRDWLGLFLLLVVVRAGIIWLRGHLIGQLRTEYIAGLRSRFYRAVAESNWRFLSGSRHADLFRMLSVSVGEISYGTSQAMQLLANLVMAGASLVVALTLSPGLTLLALLAGGGLWLHQKKRFRKSYALGVEYTEQNQSFFSSASELFDGLKLIKSAGAEQAQCADFSQRMARLADVQMRYLHDNLASRAVHGIVAGLIIAGLLLFAVDVLHLPKSELLLILLVLVRLLPVSSSLHHQIQEMLHMLPQFKEMQETLAECQAARESGQGARAGAELPFGQKLAVDRVFYTHPAAKRPALDGVSLEIGARSTVALVGVSGAGKTTLADVLLGLIAPDSGEIRVDGQPLGPENVVAWRRSAGYVPQETFLFPGTVRQNLLWGNPDCADANLREALEQAAAWGFVSQLPQGLDTVVGERGIRLSGGERQRLALARALLRKPRLLVLDEATSHLDAESEQMIQRALDNLHGAMTLIVIAHRLSTIRHADHIVVLENGRLIDQGDWSTLSTRPGRFSEILQAAAY